MHGRNDLQKYFSVVDDNVVGIIAILLPIGYIFIELLNYSVFNTVVSLLVFTFILKSIFHLQGAVAKIIYVLIGLTILLLISADNVIDILLNGALVNLPIVSILMLTPLLGISVKVAGYDSSLRIVLGKYRNNAYFFYIVFLVLTHIFSVILNIGSILINRHLMESSNVRSKRLIANSLNRGFTTITTWSPYLGVMALVVSQLQIEWFELISYTMGFVVISLFVAVTVEIKTIQKEQNRLNKLNEVEAVQVLDVKSYKGKIIELVCLLILSMGLVLFIEQFTNIKIVLAILYVSILFPLLWCLIKGQFSSYKKEVYHHIKHTIPNLQTEFTLFLVAGIFSYAFVQSSLSQKSIEILNAIFGHSVFLMAIALSSIIIFTGILGLHPAVMLTIFATSIVPEQIGLSPLFFAALLLGSSGIANTVSPATAVNNLVANNLRLDVYTVSLKWNWLFALILFITLPVYMIVVGM